MNAYLKIEDGEMNLKEASCLPREDQDENAMKAPIFRIWLNMANLILASRRSGHSKADSINRSIAMIGTGTLIMLDLWACVHVAISFHAKRKNKRQIQAQHVAEQ